MAPMAEDTFEGTDNLLKAYLDSDVNRQRLVVAERAVQIKVPPL